MVFPTNNRYCSYSCQRAHTHTYSPGHFITARSLFCFLMLQCNGGMKVYFIRISLQLDRQVQGKCKKEEHAENYFFFLIWQWPVMGKRIEEVCPEIRCAAQTNSKKKKNQEAMVGGSVRQSERKKWWKWKKMKWTTWREYLAFYLLLI